jgi:hypothetical protein
MSLFFEHVTFCADAASKDDARRKMTTTTDDAAKVHLEPPLQLLKQSAKVRLGAILVKIISVRGVQTSWTKRRR